MKLESVRILAAASKEFQKYEVEFSVSDLGKVSEDIANVKTIAVNEAIKGLNELLKAMEKEPTKEPKVETKVEPVYRTPVKEDEPVVGTIKNFDGFNYKLCFSRGKNSHFWALMNPEDEARGARKYINADKKEA